MILIPDLSDVKAAVIPVEPDTALIASFIDVTSVVDVIVAAHRNPLQYNIALEAASPMGRLGTPLDIAGAVVYLVSDEAKFVNGTEIVVDGGLTAT